jgi:hypothetical protein
MANETPRQPGLNAFADPSKLNFFGAADEDQQEYQNALNQSLTALQQRYSQPNWWKVAAAFAEPRLGGFMASLGSAANVMGENVEQQRAQELPIAQLRAQLALSKVTMGQNKSVADQYKLWKDKGENPEELMALRDFAIATAPNAPVTQAISKHYDSLSAERQLHASEQAAAIGRIQTAYHYNEEPNPEDLAFVRSGSPTLKKSPVRPQGAGQSDLSKANADMFGSTIRPMPSDANQVEATPDTGVTSAAIKPPSPITGDQAVLTKNLPPADAAPLPPVNVKSSEGVSNKLLFDPKSDLSYDNLTQQQKDSVDNLLVAKGLRPIMNTDSGKLSWEQQRTKNQNFPDLISRLNSQNAIEQPNNNAPAPAAKPAASKSVFPDPLPVQSGTYPLVNPKVTREDLAGMSTTMQTETAANIKARAAASEEAITPTVNSLLPYTNQSITIPLYQSLKTSADNINKFPKYAQQFYDVLGQGTLDAAIKKSLQAGGGINWNAVLNGSATFTLPAEAWANAKLPPEVASFGNTQLAERARQIALEAQLNGTRIDKIPVAEFHTVSAANPGQNMRWDAARHALNNDATDIYFKTQIARQYQHELQTQAYHPNEAAIKSSIFKNSPNIRGLYGVWAEQKDRLQRQRQEELTPKKP